MGKIVDQIKNKVKKAVEDTTGYLGNLYESGKNIIDKSIVQPVKDLFTPDATAMGPTNTYSGELAATGSPVIGTVDNGAKNGNGEDFNMGDFAPVGGDSSEGGTKPEVGTVTPSATPYLDYLNKAETNIREYSKYLEELAEDEKKNALEVAETEFQRASVDANAAYRRNLATYGAKAEALDRMGLNGSGYSDYLAGNAYSAMRNDIGLATGEKNAAEQAANKNYSKAMRDAAIYEKDKLNELNLERATYSENLIKENEAKKQALKSELMTMAQNGASEDDIRAYIEASGIALTDDEWKAAGTVASKVAQKIKAELVAQALLNGYNVDQIKAIAKAAGLEFGEDELTEIQNSIEGAKAEIKTEEEKQARNTILTNLLSSEGGVNSLTKSELEEYIRSFGLDPAIGAGASIMALHDGHDSITSANNSYEGEKTDAELLKGATAEITGGKAEGGNITISYKNKKYYVERDSDNRVPVDSELAGILTDTYREANDLSMKEWQEMADEDVEGSVVKHKGIFYVYLNTEGEGYGWVKTRERQTDGLWGGDVSYDELVEETGGRGGLERTAMDFGNDLNLLNYSGKNGSELRIKYNDNTYDLKIESGVTDKNKNDELKEFYKAQGGYWNPDDDADNGGKVVYYNGNLYAYVPRRKITWGGTKEEHRWALLSDTNGSKRDLNRLLRAMTE